MEETSSETQKKVNLNFVLAKIFFGFAAISLITSFILSFNTGEKIEKSISSTGGVVGPIEVDESNAVLKVKVKQNLNAETWSFVTVELLNENQEYLMGFGDEFYYETGYDSDGYWSERKEDYSTKVTVPDPGEYYIRIRPETEGNSQSQAYGSINVEIDRQMASSLPHTVVGIISIILSLVFWYRGNANRFREVFGD